MTTLQELGSIALVNTIITVLYFSQDFKKVSKKISFSRPDLYMTHIKILVVGPGVLHILAMTITILFQHCFSPPDGAQPFSSVVSIKDNCLKIHWYWVVMLSNIHRGNLVNASFQVNSYLKFYASWTGQLEAIETKYSLTSQAVSYLWVRVPQ